MYPTKLNISKLLFNLLCELSVFTITRVEHRAGLTTTAFKVEMAKLKSFHKGLYVEASLDDVPINHRKEVHPIAENKVLAPLYLLTGQLYETLIEENNGYKEYIDAYTIYIR